jgi:hypothetical protein
VDFKSKSARTEFDETVISAQEVARAMSVTPHMMGRDMQYDGMLVLGVAGVDDEDTGKKATTALRKVEGVAKVTLYPKQQAVGIEFTSKGKVTSKQLLEALDAAGLKGTQSRTASGASGQAMNGGNGSMPEHAGMARDNGGMPGRGAMGDRMGCGCAPYYGWPGAAPWVYYGSGGGVRGGCGCCR